MIKKTATGQFNPDVHDWRYFSDPINQVDELKCIAGQLDGVLADTLMAIAEDIEADAMHVFSPTEDDRDACRRCGHNFRCWSHLGAVGERKSD